MPIIPLFVPPLVTTVAAARMAAFNFCMMSDDLLPVADASISAFDRGHLSGMSIGITYSDGSGGTDPSLVSLIGFVASITQARSRETGVSQTGAFKTSISQTREWKATLP